MNFHLSDEQQEIQETARAFAKKEMAPYAQQWDEDSFFPIETLQKAAKLGFAGIYVRA